MPLPHVIIAGKKVAIFKHFEHLYGPFINTTPANSYPVRQLIQVHDEAFNFKWPSSEQAYHAQKILHVKEKFAPQDPVQAVLTQALWDIHNATKDGEEFLPKDYQAIAAQLTASYPHVLGKDKTAFDHLSDADFHQKTPRKGINPKTAKPYTLNFMRTVLRLKLEQHHELRNLAIQMAREGILPMEISRNDYNWASGPDGSGLNMLGILFLEEGNRLLTELFEIPVISNPERAYKELQRNAQAQICHDVLEPQEKQMKADTKHTPETDGDWVINANQTKAAFICNGEVITGIYRNPPHPEWICSDDLPRFQNIPDYKNTNCFHQTNQGTKTIWVYNHTNPKLATKAALCQNDIVITGIFRRNGIHSDWEKSGNLSLFANMIPQKQHSVEALINHLQLDNNNHVHMDFWQKKMTFRGVTYKNISIPHTIAKALAYIERNKTLAYNEFKTGLEQVLKEPSGSVSSIFGLNGLFRSKAVSDLREHAENATTEHFTF